MLLIQNLDKKEKHIGLQSSETMIQKEVKCLNTSLSRGEIKKKVLTGAFFFKSYVSNIPKPLRQFQRIEKKRNISSFYKARS